jgi:hypothetical protein
LENFVLKPVTTFQTNENFYIAVFVCDYDSIPKPIEILSTHVLTRFGEDGEDRWGDDVGFTQDLIIRTNGKLQYISKFCAAYGISTTPAFAIKALIESHIWQKYTPIVDNMPTIKSLRETGGTLEEIELEISVVKRLLFERLKLENPDWNEQNEKSEFLTKMLFMLQQARQTLLTLQACKS